MVRGWSTSLSGEAEGAGLGQQGEEAASGGPNSNTQCLQADCQGHKARLFIYVCGRGT